MPWMTACRAEEVLSGAIKRQRLSNGKPVALTRLTDDRIVAFENKCPHFGGPLAMGKVSGTEIVCPWHFFRFDLVTGETANVDQSIMRIKVFPVTIEKGEVLVEAD